MGGAICISTCGPAPKSDHRFDCDREKQRREVVALSARCAPTMVGRAAGNFGNLKYQNATSAEAELEEIYVRFAPFQP